MFFSHCLKACMLPQNLGDLSWNVQYSNFWNCCLCIFLLSFFPCCIPKDNNAQRGKNHFFYILTNFVDQGNSVFNSQLTNKLHQQHKLHLRHGRVRWWWSMRTDRSHGMSSVHDNGIAFNEKRSAISHRRKKSQQRGLKSARVWSTSLYVLNVVASRFSGGFGRGQKHQKRK